MRIYRFGDFVAINPPDGSTFYLKASEALALENAVSEVLSSISTERFSKSKVGTFDIPTTGERY